MNCIYVYIMFDLNCSMFRDMTRGTCDPFQRDMAKGTCGPFGLFIGTRLRARVTLLAFSKGHG